MKKLLLLAILLAFIAVVYCDEPTKTTKPVDVSNDSIPEGDVTDEEEEDAPAKVYTNVADVLKDVKENKLKDLFVRGVKINDDEAKLIAGEIETNQQLDRFVLTKNDDLKVSALKIIVSAFAKNPKLRVVGFTKNKIGDDGAAVIADGLSGHAGFQKFYLYHTDVTAKGIESIVKSLATLKSLVKTVVIENKIGDEGALLFAEFLKKSQLSDFVLRDCEVKAAGFKAIGAAIKETKSLLKVDLSENPMDADSVNGVASGLDGNDHLTHIELAFNNIDAAGAKVLAAALVNNKHLKRVDLSENKLGNDGAKDLAAFIEKDTPLEKLDLSNNKITTEGAKLLVESVLKSKNLKRLFFYRNEGDDSLKELFKKVGDRVKSEFSDDISVGDGDDKEVDEEKEGEDKDDEDDEDDKEEKPSTPATPATSNETPKKDEL